MAGAEVLSGALSARDLRAAAGVEEDLVMAAEQSPGIPLPWRPPDALRPRAVAPNLIAPQLLAGAVADYVVPAIFALQGSEHEVLADMDDQLATFRTRLLGLSNQ